MLKLEYQVYQYKNCNYYLTNPLKFPVMKKSSIILLASLVSMLISCGKDKTEWEKIKTSENIQELENYISGFPKSSYFDSALIKMEKLIYLQSINSVSKSGTFEEYEYYVKNYPKIMELTDAEKRMEYLKLKADTIEICGKLVDSEDKPVAGKEVIAWPINEKGNTVLSFIKGILSNPRGFSDSAGSFMAKGHRSFILENNEFILEVNRARLISEDGVPVTVRTDSNNRIIDLGKIIVK